MARRRCLTCGQLGYCACAAAFDRLAFAPPPEPRSRRRTPSTPERAPDPEIPSHAVGAYARLRNVK